MTSGVRVRGAGAPAVVVVVVLVVGLLAGSTAKLPERGSEPRVLHPLVIDDSDFIHGGYANGARVLTLPGNAVGVSADRSIMATRSTGGDFTGYRLRDGGVAWRVSGAQIAARECSGWVYEILWFLLADRGYAWCWPEDGGPPHAALDLQNGRWLEFTFLRKYPGFEYVGDQGNSFYITVLDSVRGQVRLIRLGLDGRELSSVPLFTATAGDSLDPSGCKLAGADRVVCRRPRTVLVFDRGTGHRLVALPGSSATLTADGYRVWDGEDTGVFYNVKGEAIAPFQRHSKCGFVPGWREFNPSVLYSNADLEAQTADCRFKLVGPSGRVFLEYSYRNSYALLPQAGSRLGLSRALPSAAISRNEQVLAVVPWDDRPSEDGIRLLNPSTGELIASFPMPWGYFNNGIVFWTDNEVNPDNLIGTQVLVPGP